MGRCGRRFRAGAAASDGGNGAGDAGVGAGMNSTALFVGISVGAMLAGIATAHWGLMALPLVSIGLALLAILSSLFSNAPRNS